MLLYVLNGSGRRRAVRLHPVFAIAVSVNEIKDKALQSLNAAFILNLAARITERNVRNIYVDDDHTALYLFVKPCKELDYQILSAGIGRTHFGTVNRTSDSTPQRTFTDKSVEIPLDLLFRLYSAHFTMPFNSCFNRLSAFNSAVVSTSLWRTFST